MATQEVKEKVALITGITGQVNVILSIEFGK